MRNDFTEQKLDGSPLLNASDGVFAGTSRWRLQRPYFSRSAACARDDATVIATRGLSRRRKIVFRFPTGFASARVSATFDLWRASIVTI
jgi:hypothetical protein